MRVLSFKIVLSKTDWYNLYFQFNSKKFVAMTFGSMFYNANRFTMSSLNRFMLGISDISCVRSFPTLKRNL